MGIILSSSWDEWRMPHHTCLGKEMGVSLVAQVRVCSVQRGFGSLDLGVLLLLIMF